MFKFLTVLCLLFSFFSYSHTDSGDSDEGIIKRTIHGGCPAYFWTEPGPLFLEFKMHVHDLNGSDDGTYTIRKGDYLFFTEHPNSELACSYCAGCSLQK